MYIYLIGSVVGFYALKGGCICHYFSHVYPAVQQTQDNNTEMSFCGTVVAFPAGLLTLISTLMKATGSEHWMT